jgi:hypothetical protein
VTQQRRPSWLQPRQPGSTTIAIDIALIERRVDVVVSREPMTIDVVVSDRRSKTPSRVERRSAPLVRDPRPEDKSRSRSQP